MRATFAEGTRGRTNHTIIHNLEEAFIKVERGTSVAHLSFFTVVWLTFLLISFLFARSLLTSRRRSERDEKEKDSSKKSHSKRKDSFLKDSEVEMVSQEPFQPNLIGGKSMLSSEQVQKVSSNFPIHLQLYDWQLVFNTAVHGFSLDNLYRLMEKYLKGPSFMCIKDEHNHICGVFTLEPWRRSQEYYGNGSTFVMSIQPSLKVYRWTFENDYFLCCRDEWLGVGGGDGGFALWVDENLERGTSAGSSTFGNKCLLSSDSFEVVQVEIWMIGYTPSLQGRTRSSQNLAALAGGESSHGHGSCTTQCTPFLDDRKRRTSMGSNVSEFSDGREVGMSPPPTPRDEGESPTDKSTLLHAQTNMIGVVGSPTYRPRTSSHAERNFDGFVL